MLKTWTQINKEHFAKGSRPAKASWTALIMQGAIDGKVIAGTPYINEDMLLTRVEITPRSNVVAMLNLLD